MNKRILITGANGFLASYIINEARQKGYTVVATDTIDKKEHLPDIQFYKADLLDKNRLTEITKNIDVIVHCAAIFDLSVSKERLYQVNAIGTKNIFEAAIENKVAQFIHISSCDIYGALKYIPAGIDHPKNPKNNYAWSKLQAEEVIHNHHDRDKIQWTIIRPSMLYGPRSAYVAAILFSVPCVLRYLGVKKLPYFTGGTKVTLVHVEDVAGSVVFSLLNERTYNKIFNIAEEEVIEMGTIVELLLKNFGIKPCCTLPISKFFLNLVSSILLALPNCLSAGVLSFFVVRFWKRIIEKYDLKRDFYPKLHKEFYSYFFGDRVFSIDDIKKAGYVIKHKSIKYSLTQTLDWYRENKWLPPFKD